jgi:maltose O-acetyltransferase
MESFMISAVRRVTRLVRAVLGAARAHERALRQQDDVVQKLGSVGARFEWSAPFRVLTPERVSIGDDVYLSSGMWISSLDRVVIGDRVLCGPDCMILATDHDFESVGRHSRYLPVLSDPSFQVRLEDNCWLGARVIVLKGVSVGMGAVVGAGSLVVRDIPPYVVAAGNPCKPLRKIFGDDALVEHLTTLGYDLPRANEVVSLRAAGLARQKPLTGAAAVVPNAPRVTSAP